MIMLGPTVPCPSSASILVVLRGQEQSPSRPYRRHEFFLRPDGPKCAPFLSQDLKVDEIAGNRYLITHLVESGEGFVDEIGGAAARFREEGPALRYNPSIQNTALRSRESIPQEPFDKILPVSSAVDHTRRRGKSVPKGRARLCHPARRNGKPLALAIAPRAHSRKHSIMSGVQYDNLSTFGPD